MAPWPDNQIGRPTPSYGHRRASDRSFGSYLCMSLQAAIRQLEQGLSCGEENQATKNTSFYIIMMPSVFIKLLFHVTQTLVPVMGDLKYLSLV